MGSLPKIKGSWTHCLRVMETLGTDARSSLKVGSPVWRGTVHGEISTVGRAVAVKSGVRGRVPGIFLAVSRIDSQLGWDDPNIRDSPPFLMPLGYLFHCSPKLAARQFYYELSGLIRIIVVPSPHL